MSKFKKQYIITVSGDSYHPPSLIAGFLETQKELLQHFEEAFNNGDKVKTDIQEVEE